MTRAWLLALLAAFTLALLPATADAGKRRGGGGSVRFRTHTIKTGKWLPERYEYLTDGPWRKNPPQPKPLH